MSNYQSVSYFLLFQNDTGRSDIFQILTGAKNLKNSQTEIGQINWLGDYIVYTIRS